MGDLVLTGSRRFGLTSRISQSLPGRVGRIELLPFSMDGLAAALMGTKDAAAPNIHPQRGAPFETLVVSEFLKARFNTGRPAGLHLWRDNTGNEVDLLFEAGTGLQPVERKRAPPSSAIGSRALPAGSHLPVTRRCRAG